jgi:hypothetical protein
MRVHEPSTVFKRTLAGGRVVHYWRADDEVRKRPTSARSTGKDKKGEALAYCRKLEKEGGLLTPDEPVAPAPEALIFGSFTVDFWSWEGAYVKTRLQFSDPTKPAISQRHAHDMARVLELRILPTFRRRILHTITPTPEVLSVLLKAGADKAPGPETA